MNDEKRHVKRRPTTLVFEIYDSEGLLMQGTGRLTNLSDTGALLESAQSLAPDQALRLRLRLKGHALLEVSVRVVRILHKVQVRTYGVRFEPLSAAQLEQLRRLS